tara:strand:+ start:804 stop:1868 length:1065 start_codon:yes stop_codon:yes gene_type:complete
MVNLSAGKGNEKYKIVIANSALPYEILKNAIKNNPKIMVVTDSGVPKKYINLVTKTLKNKTFYVHIVPKGESSKSYKEFRKIISKLIDKNFDRSDAVIALGGGVVGDLTGFCAATYLRGIDYIQIPTTLLSQVDSSVGGKTGINITQGKNLIGSFYNPKIVLIVIKFLSTLSEYEYKSGMGEVVKYALIRNTKLRKILEMNSKQIKKRDLKVLSNIIEESIKTKSKIVVEDEKEEGIRAILNFGHTFGHAIEAYNNYKKISHGAAITLGMVIASKVSFYEGYIKETQLKKIISLIESLELNTNHSKYKYAQLNKFIKNDKKINKGKLNLILVNNKFKAFKTDNFDVKNISKAFD